jgi:hypothetical protein
MATTLRMIRPGMYRLWGDDEMAECVSVEVGLLTDVYDALGTAERFAEGAQFSIPSVKAATVLQAALAAVSLRLGLVLDHVRAERRKEENPYPMTMVRVVEELGEWGTEEVS